MPIDPRMVKWDEAPKIPAAMVKWDEEPAQERSATVDTANAVGTGYLRGLTRLAALPVDTVANVLDLGKAAIGAPYIAATGKAPPEWLQVKDRADVVGSGENVIRAASKTKAGNLLLNPANPEYEGGWAQNAGGAATAIMAPSSGIQAANQAVIGQMSAAAAKLAYEKTGDPAYAVLAGLAPLGAQQAVTGGVKMAVRGGEAGRVRMEQRIQDLRNAGVDQPTLGLASGNQLIGGVENLLQSTPGAVGVMRNARDRAVAGMQGTATTAANRASPIRGSAAAGEQIQRDLNGLREHRIGPTFELLNDRVVNAVGPNTQVPVPNAIAATGRLSTPDPGAPATSGMLIQPRIRQLNEALLQDTNQGAGGVPFQSLRNQRTSIGAESRSTPLTGTPEGAQFRQTYGALSQDMLEAARTADRTRGITAGQAGSAEQALNRSNRFYAAGMDRVDRVRPFAEAKSPEQSFTGLMNTTKENNTILQAVKKSVTPGTRGAVAGTVIDRLGRANPSNQNELGDVFSPERFLTNWNGMTPRARSELFSGFPNSAQVRAEVESIARAASMMRENSQMWANPSGSGANVAARATLGTIAAGGTAALTGLLNPVVPLAAAGGLLGTRMLAGRLTSPGVVGAMANRGYVSPAMLNAQAASLLAPGLLSQ